MKKYFIIVLSLIVIVAFTIVPTVFVVAKNKIPKDFIEEVNNTIVIDAGHGGIDGGASGVTTKTEEKVINLKLSYVLKKQFENFGYNVVLTRKDDNALYDGTESGFKVKDLNKRIEIVNSIKPIIFISIHMNKYSLKSRRGAQVFFKNDVESEKLATKIQNGINNMKESPRILSCLVGDYYVLNYSNVPSVIIECGFLSNEQDEKLLLDEKYLKKLAVTICESSIKYIKMEK